MSNGAALLSELDCSGLSYRKFHPEGKDKPTYYINLSESRRENVVFQIGDSEMKQHEMPFAIRKPSSYMDANPLQPSLYLAVPCPKTREVLNTIDDRVAALVQENNLLKAGATLDYVKDMQTRLLKEPRKEGHSTGISLKLNRDVSSKRFTHIARLVCTEDNNFAHVEASVDDIVKGTIVFAIAELSPIWFRGKEWGVSLNAKMLLIVMPGKEDGEVSTEPTFVIKGNPITKLDKDAKVASTDHMESEVQEGERKRPRKEDPGEELEDASEVDEA